MYTTVHIINWFCHLCEQTRGLTIYTWQIVGQSTNGGPYYLSLNLLPKSEINTSLDFSEICIYLGSDLQSRWNMFSKVSLFWGGGHKTKLTNDENAWAFTYLPCSPHGHSFSPKSFCNDGLRHTPWECSQTHTQTEPIHVLLPRLLTRKREVNIHFRESFWYYFEQAPQHLENTTPGALFRCYEQNEGYGPTFWWNSLSLVYYIKGGVL